ncbi:hypothetical protein L3i22_074020 [Actinoplanes sp. L3-i22]|nr:hypothetical protein L3i22_074020 [Actinoplanes sp. L3-i22]
MEKKWVDPAADPFPLGITESFSPNAIKHLLDRIHDNGTLVPVEEPFRGRPVVGMEWDGWSALVTTEYPQTLVWFGGPITKSSPIKPASWTSSAPSTVKTISAYATNAVPRYALAPVPLPQVPYVSVTVNDAPEDAANAVQQAVAKVLPQAAQPGAGQTPEEPPAEQSMVAEAPMTFANPAPAIPGRITRIPVSYTADLVSPDLAGPSQAVIDRLRSRGIEVPGNSNLNDVDEVQKAIAYQALDVMSSRPGFRPAKVLEVVENAFRENAVPELMTLTQSGRLDNPQDLPES